MSEKAKSILAYIFGWLGGLIVLFAVKDNGKNIPETGWKSLSLSFDAIQKDDEWIKEDGTYNTPQTVKINVYFNEGIKGSTTPTLKIKFGDSPERTLTNGTIKNTGAHFIEYSYNIQDTDKGQLQTVSFSGGNITDQKGNKAVLSCPVLSGSTTIKANTKATTTNNTANQNTTNNNTDKTNSDKNNADKNDSNNSTTNKPTNTGSTGTTNNTSSTNKKDTTVASGKIPQTGVGIGLTLLIVAVFSISILAYSKYKKLKDI